jgi:hypothetical protein
MRASVKYFGGKFYGESRNGLPHFGILAEGGNGLPSGAGKSGEMLDVGRPND